ncbi:unnamed protein product [Phytophthora lilii]|uniref:Unnamed protein product n=1 Tax=Phytophthora lilii TaxID=2077276 RepID=A0A9W6TCX6_9STRA|nr:unnamed protein product [Phytophthora lilii]
MDSEEPTAEVSTDSPELVVEQSSPDEEQPATADETTAEQGLEADQPQLADNEPGLADEDNGEVGQQADLVPEDETPVEEVSSAEDTLNHDSAVNNALDADQVSSNQAESPQSAEAVDPVVNGDSVAVGHQALDMDSLEKTIIPEPSKKISPTTLARAASRLGSFRQGMTRDERVKSMVSQAEGKARKDRLGEGLKSVFQATMDDIGALGIGMQLYFMLTKYLSVVFVLMGIISLPAIMVNSYGHGITSKMVDPLQLAYSSIGNGGVNSDTAATARSCLPLGDIDCTWETVDTPLTSNPKTVTWIVTATDILYSFFFMCFLLFYSYRAKKAIKEHQNKHLTPARYAVMVRGLPKDATEKEILKHFNDLYDLTKDEEYSKLWFGMCWGKRQKVNRSRSKKAVNRNVVSNVDHLEDSTTINKNLYLNTWIAEVSVAHPTGGLLRTFLSMESLGQKKEETELLVRTLEAEKSHSPMDFKAADEKLIHASRKKFDKLQERLKKKKAKIKALKEVIPESDEALEKKNMKEEHKANSLSSKEKLAAAAKAAKKAATNTQQAFNWEACECAFVVFNNLESRRRCLQDYRQSTRWLSRKWQPKLLRFRETHPLVVTSAPEPSNILWENLEVTDRGRFYRHFLTNLVTVMLLVISCAIISAAQSTQEQCASKMPPEGLCDRALPAVYYADTSFSMNAQKRAILWSLAWDPDKTCSDGTSGETRYHIAYTNGIQNALDTSRLSYGSDYPDPERCVDPCISESSTEVCNTLPCFYYNELVKSDGMTCQTYEASHVLYCFCSTQLTSSIKQYGFVDGPQKLWENIPCRGFTKDYLVKNSFILLAAGIVVIVNFLLDNILRLFAVFERHTSESTRTIRVAVRMFGAQFLNTALIVIIVNASFGLSTVPVAKELLGGKYKDFERGWYPTVGMGIATTMLLNAFLPQFTLFLDMYVVSPIRRWYKRRAIRTQAKMDKLYAGPKFDISQRYPMVLNSVFVTMVFCGGSPVLLFIGAVASAGIYWFDKLSILYLYSVKTTYDEILGEVTLQVLPWTLALHLGFSAWMYGNTDLLKGTMIDLPWLLRSVGLSSVLDENPNATTDQLYALLTDKLGKYDVLGQYGFLVKIVYSHVMLMTVLCFIVTLGLLLYTIFGRLVFVVLGQMLSIIKQILLAPVELAQSLLSKEDSEALSTETDSLQQKEKLPVVMLPEFTEPFLKSVSRKYKPDEGLGFQKDKVDNTEELTCVWPEDTIHKNGVERSAGDRKLTWETMQAPVKSYAIEANEKYALAVSHIIEAWELIKQARGKEHIPDPVLLGKVMPMLDNQHEHHVENAVTATEIITVVAADSKKDEDPEDASAEDTRPEEAAASPETEAASLPVDEEQSSNNEEGFFADDADEEGEASAEAPTMEQDSEEAASPEEVGCEEQTEDGGEE